jgi:hypothetical protein
VSFDAESPDERLAAPLLTRRSWSSGSDYSSGVLPPTVSTVTAEQSGLPPGAVRAIAVVISIAIVRTHLLRSTKSLRLVHCIHSPRIRWANARRWRLC